LPGTVCHGAACSKLTAALLQVYVPMIRIFWQFLLLAAFAPIAIAAEPGTVTTRPLPDLPRPISNNAVAAIASGAGVTLFSFLGLESGKRWSDTSSAAFALGPEAAAWVELPPVPGSEGRLAASAVAVAERVYIFGGYTVAEDGSEKSTPNVHAFDPDKRTYIAREPMPIPVDDSLAVVYGERLIYLVSGWHDHGNVNLVQLYDTVADSWSQATPYPGAPVFGHAGGIVGNTLVVCDGVAIHISATELRRYQSSAECYRGEIDPQDPRRIDWYGLASHPGVARYRMAAAGMSSDGGWVIFAGGSDNPYNYNGTGYDGRPANPVPTIFGYSLALREWRELGQLDKATMDHRALVVAGTGFVLIGGMRENQQVSASALSFGLVLP